MADFESRLRETHGPAFKNKDALLSEVSHKLCKLQKLSMVVYDKDVVSISAWKRSLAEFEYKTLWLLLEVTDMVLDLSERLTDKMIEIDKQRKKGA
jgi:hypothetical protein